MRIGAKALPPEPLAEQSHLVVLPGLVLVRMKQPAERGPDTQESEEPGRSLEHGDMLRIAESRQVAVSRVERAHLFKGLVARPNVPKVGFGERRLVPAVPRARLPELHQPGRFRERKWPQQHGVKHAENGRCRAYAEREGDDGQCRGCGVLDDDAHGAAQVREKIVHGQPLGPIRRRATAGR